MGPDFHELKIKYKRLGMSKVPAINEGHDKFSINSETTKTTHSGIHSQENLSYVITDVFLRIM